MSETAGAAPVMSSPRIVEECVVFAQRNGQSAVQIDQMDRRATPRILFTHPIRYSPHLVLSEDHTKTARMLDVSLGGMGLLCCETIAEGTVFHAGLPVLDGKTAWVRGAVVYCRPDAEYYRVGIAFIPDRN